MARGYIYEITDNIDAYGIHLMGADEICNSYPQEADYYRELDETELGEAKSDLIHTMESYGFRTGKLEDETLWTDEPIPWFEASNFGKRNYFRNRLQELQKMASNITLDQFANIPTTGDVDRISSVTLKNLIDDDYTNAVYFNNSFYTFDEFMRNLEPDRKYYIGTICLMH